MNIQQPNLKEIIEFVVTHKSWRQHPDLNILSDRVELRSVGTTTPRQGWPRPGRSRLSTPILTTRSDQITRPPVQGLTRDLLSSLPPLSKIGRSRQLLEVMGIHTTADRKSSRSKGEMYSWRQQNFRQPSQNFLASCTRESLTTARWLPRGSWPPASPSPGRWSSLGRVMRYICM